jgi:hypothetical protein
MGNCQGDTTIMAPEGPELASKKRTANLPEFMVNLETIDWLNAIRI